MRKVCEDSLNTLVRVGAEADILSDAVFTLQNLVDATNSALKENGCANPESYSVLVNFMAQTTHFLVLGDNRAKDDWEQCIVPYVTAIVGAEKAELVAVNVTTAGTAALSPGQLFVVYKYCMGLYC